ncbi:MAG: prephenate dehydrogenase/arogenate dehydrogenase family protein [bacterium]|nr:prephenate dehydrogenase/arogenate dehydrogenase family protein [bacterium]
MIYEKTAVVGVGLLGGSLAGAFKKYNISEEITGISRSDASFRAADKELVDRAFALSDLRKGICDADLVVFALPIKQIVLIIPEVIELVKPGCVITDVGSTKTDIIRTANENRKDGIHFIGGHPMAGSEKTGFEAGSEDLFLNRPYAIVESDNTPGEVLSDYKKMVETIGARPVIIDAQTHDRIAAGISHLPHVISIALMNVIGKENKVDPRYFKLSGPSFDEMTRISGSAYSIWDDIISSNKDILKEFIDDYINLLSDIRNTLGSIELEQYFSKSNSDRNELLNSKGD